MVRVKRGYNNVTGGNGTSKYRKYNSKFYPKKSEATLDPPIQFNLKFEGKCKNCQKIMRVGSEALYNGSRVWHISC